MSGAKKCKRVRVAVTCPPVSASLKTVRKCSHETLLLHMLCSGAKYPLGNLITLIERSVMVANKMPCGDQVETYFITLKEIVEM